MEIFDQAGALKAFGKEQILRATVEVFLSEAEGMRQKLREATRGGDMAETAHWLKGGFAALYAPAARHAAEELETAARDGRDTASLAAALDEEILRLSAHFADK